MFHVSLLQLTSSSELPNRAIHPPPPIELDNSDDWEVSQVLNSKFDHHRRCLGLLYLIKWKGFDNTPDAKSWEPPGHLENVPTLVQASIRHILTSQFLKSLG